LRIFPCGVLAVAHALQKQKISKVVALLCVLYTMTDVSSLLKKKKIACVILAVAHALK